MNGSIYLLVLRLPYPTYIFVLCYIVTNVCFFHMIYVAGECRLENMRTLCIACHAEVTAAQCAERRSERAKAKKQLNRLLANLKTVQDNHHKVLKIIHIYI